MGKGKLEAGGRAHLRRLPGVTWRRPRVSVPTQEGAANVVLRRLPRCAGGAGGGAGGAGRGGGGAARRARRCRHGRPQRRPGPLRRPPPASQPPHAARALACSLPAERAAAWFERAAATRARPTPARRTLSRAVQRAPCRTGRSCAAMPSGHSAARPALTLWRAPRAQSPFMFNVIWRIAQRLCASTHRLCTGRLGLGRRRGGGLVIDSWHWHAAGLSKRPSRLVMP